MRMWRCEPGSVCVGFLGVCLGLDLDLDCEISDEDEDVDFRATKGRSRDSAERREYCCLSKADRRDDSD